MAAVKRSDRHLIAHRIDDGAKVTEHAGNLTITVPIKLARRGGETSIEGPNGGPATESRRVDATLIDAIAKAQTWCAQLLSGEVKSMKDLAHIERCNESHVRHRINLAFLAPDIVEMILNGRQPPHLMLERLVRLDLPLDWRKQR